MRAEYEKAKSELQAESPGDGFQFDRAAIGGKKIGQAEDYGNA
jgi:hypothetical protein